MGALQEGRGRPPLCFRTFAIRGTSLWYTALLYTAHRRSCSACSEQYACSRHIRTPQQDTAARPGQVEQADDMSVMSPRQAGSLECG